MKDKLQVIKNMGLSWTLFRTKYELKKKLGILEKQFPPVMLSDEQFLGRISMSYPTPNEFIEWWKKEKQPFFFDGLELKEYKTILKDIRGVHKDNVLTEADDICSNSFRYFSSWQVNYSQLNWHINPTTKKIAPSNLHWTKIPDLNTDFGDIKYIWELSRFPFVYTLVRAYAVEEKDKYVETFWRLFEDWVDNNPVELGVHYKCCQEMSIRVMAWLIGLYAFYHHPASSNKRLFALIKHIYYHTNHIEKHFEFALKSVKNNHTITEAAAMYTVGILFPFLDLSNYWKTKGNKYLEAEGLRQIYDDGSYLQHSMNYQRLVIQNYTWVFQLAHIHKESYSKKLQSRLLDSLLFLFNQQDQNTGRLPNYGMNDGALIHPLSESDYLDYRPQLTTLYYVLTKKKLYSLGIHDENLLWICGNESVNAPVNYETQITKAYKVGGYYTLHGGESFGMIRCGTYRDRPSQADMLHLDLWWKGENILCDAGTYSYNTAKRWLSYFNGTASHNTIMVNQKDQMRKGTRFIWLDWTAAKLIRFSKGESFQFFEGEHDGYSPLIHRRAVLNDNDVWIVIDDIVGEFKGKEYEISQQWLLGTKELLKINNNHFKLNTESGISYSIRFIDQVKETEVYYGDLDKVRGWASTHYGKKAPAHQLYREIKTNKQTRLISCFYPSENKVILNDSKEQISINNRLYQLQPLGAKHMIKSE
jgi:hypothetical protein